MAQAACLNWPKAGGTANLAVFDKNDLEIIFVEQIDSPIEVQIKLRIGARVNAHTTGVGKTILAFLESALVRQRRARLGSGS